MNRYTLAAITSVLCVAAFSLSGRGQQAPPPQQPGGAREATPGDMSGGFSVMVPPPLTRLEALAAQKGVVILRGFSDVATLNGDDGSRVLVSAVQFSDGTSKEHGVAFHVSQPVEGRTVQTVAYVDEQEIDGLVAAIESLAKLQDGASPLQQFDARYQTQGALELISANVNGGRMILVRAMELHPGADQPAMAQSQFFASRLPELGQHLTSAKQLLAKVKSTGQPQPAQ